MENTLTERLEADLLIKYYGARAAEENPEVHGRLLFVHQD